MTMRAKFSSFLVLAILASCVAVSAACGEELRIGSKKFTESVILADIAEELGLSTGAKVSHLHELGGTRMLWDALRAGEIDLYPEYSDTLKNEIFADRSIDDDEALDKSLAALGLKKSAPLGFSDAYVLGMKRETAQRLNIRRISDLARHLSLRIGLSDEFLRRRDGWPSLATAYGLSAAEARGFDHDVSYKALLDNSIDVIDLYATDPEASDPRICLLADDLEKLHDNPSILIYRADLEHKAPLALSAMLRMVGRIDAAAMMAMNKSAKFGMTPEQDIASRFVAANFGLPASSRTDDLAHRTLRRTVEHLRLTLVSLAAAIAVAVPLGTLAANYRQPGRVIIAFAAIMQTIPSLALLVFMIPVLGVGSAPAIAALFLYSLLPIVRNTVAGLTNIPASLRSSAIALGLAPMRRLLLIELPLASPSILAGIKTAAVINVGTATLGALIGAGGYGQPIFSGVRLDNFAMVLEGAIPAALLALAVDGAFDLIGRRLLPRGLRFKRNASL
jgi:osmoprotectant transport system permease protein